MKNPFKFAKKVDDNIGAMSGQTSKPQNVKVIQAIYGACVSPGHLCSENYIHLVQNVSNQIAGVSPSGGSNLAQAGLALEPGNILAAKGLVQSAASDGGGAEAFGDAGAFAAAGGDPLHIADVDPAALEEYADLESLGCGNSFAPTTEVLMADGSAKPIKDVKVGDKVTATEPVSGLTRAEPVTKLHDNHDTDMTDVSLRTNIFTTTTIHTTTKHPFWDETRHQWVGAGDLLPGDRLHTDNVATATVVAVHTWTGAQDMRNLTVRNLHIYYVMAGSTPVLVHNCPRATGKGRGSDTPSWFSNGQRAQPNETPVQAATRVMNDQYGAGNWKAGANTEYNKIKKFFERNR